MKNIKWMGTSAVTAAGTLVAVLCATRWMPAQTVPAARIAVAAVDIDLGQRLAPRFIKLIDWPAGKIPPGAFSDPHKLEGRVLSASMVRGEPLTEGRLQPVRPPLVSLHLVELATLTTAHRDAKPTGATRNVGGLPLKLEDRSAVRYNDPETAAWLSLLAEPWAPITPDSAGAPVGA